MDSAIWQSAPRSFSAIERLVKIGIESKSVLKRIAARGKLFVLFGAICLALVFACVAEPPISFDSEAAQWQRISNRLRTEWKVTNFVDFTNHPLLRALIVHPAFGLHWDEVPPPTMTNVEALARVHAFVATNGWNMHTGILGRFSFVREMKQINGLPWKEIHDREFKAVTHDGILYIVLSGWHYNDSGVAYNPKTNTFAKSIAGFKPLGGHWYAWAQPEDPIQLKRHYE